MIGMADADSFMDAVASTMSRDEAAMSSYDYRI